MTLQLAIDTGPCALGTFSILHDRDILFISAHRYMVVVFGLPTRTHYHYYYCAFSIPPLSYGLARRMILDVIRIW